MGQTGAEKGIKSNYSALGRRRWTAGSVADKSGSVQPGPKQLSEVGHQDQRAQAGGQGTAVRLKEQQQ